jgi:hypothetical protein
MLALMKQGTFVNMLVPNKHIHIPRENEKLKIQKSDALRGRYCRFANALREHNSLLLKDLYGNKKGK